MTTAGSVSWKKTVLVSALLLVAAGGLTFVIFSTEPTAARGGATKKTAMLVEVTGVERGTFRPVLVATGTVRPEQDTVLSPRVSGEIIERSPGFTPGGFVEEGEVLVQLDPADYRNVLEQRRSDLRQVLSELNLEMGRQQVAEKEFGLLDEGDASAEGKARALRQPQLESGRARVDSARAAVDQAKLDLRRTRIRAPFAGQVLSRDVSVGSQVSPGDRLGRLVGVDTYWVVVTVPHSKLRWLSFPEGDEDEASTVRVRNRGAWPEGVYRTGHLHRPVGALDEQTRMVRVIVAIPDPLAREVDATEEAPPLVIGEFLEARIRGKEIPDAIRVNRDYVRDEDTVWVMEDGKLAIREVGIVTRDEQYAYIAEGLADDDRVVTTNLSTVTEGARLRLQAEGSGDAGTAAAASAD